MVVMTAVSTALLNAAKHAARQTERVVLGAGQATRCPACGSAAWKCWAEVENPDVVEGVVVNCAIEAGLQCADCGHVWIEVSP